MLGASKRGSAPTGPRLPLGVYVDYDGDDAPVRTTTGAREQATGETGEGVEGKEGREGR